MHNCGAGIRRESSVLDHATFQTSGALKLGMRLSSPIRSRSMMCLAVISRWENLGHYHSALAGTESSSSEAEIAEPCLCFEIVKVIACLAASEYAAISILKIDLGPGPCPSAIFVAPLRYQHSIFLQRHVLALRMVSSEEVPSVLFIFDWKAFSLSRLGSKETN